MMLLWVEKEANSAVLPMQANGLPLEKDGAQLFGRDAALSFPGLLMGVRLAAKGIAAAI